MTNVASLALEQKLREVVHRAARLLPGDAGRRLLAMLSPESLATMAAVVVIWAGSHFFGVGEIADVILLLGGIATVGMTAVDGGKKLMAFAVTTHAAKSEADLDRAARDLADGLSIIGIEGVLALLFRRPSTVFRHISPAGGARLPSLAQAMKDLPRAGPLQPYEVRIAFTRSRIAGEGGTTPLNRVTLGRAWHPDAGSKAEAIARIRSALDHEVIHASLNRSFSMLGRPGLYVKMGAYKRSYILRYLEEAAAEAHAQWRNPRPLGTPVWYNFAFDTRYDVTLAQMGREARGVLLGPVVVGGATYHAWHGHRRHDH